MPMATHTATSSLIASFSSGQTVQTWMKRHTRLHATQVITPTFVQNENGFFSTLVPYIAHKQTMWAQITRNRYGARSGPTLFGKKRESDFFVEYDSIFIRANSVDPHGIRHTAVFIMIVTFHQDTCLSDLSELWNSS